MTATNVSFDLFGKRLNGSENVCPNFTIKEEELRTQVTGKVKRQAGTIVLELNKLARSSMWSQSVLFNTEELTHGRVIIFTHSKKATEEIANQIRKQLPHHGVQTFYAGKSLDFAQLNNNAIIVNTNALGVSVTVKDCTVVVDLGLELEPYLQVECDTAKNIFCYKKELREIIVTKQAAQQRRGRTGRTCDGIYYYFGGINMQEQKTYPNTVMYETYYKICEHKKQAGILDFINNIKIPMLKNILIDISEQLDFESLQISEKKLMNVRACQGDRLALVLQTEVSQEWVDAQKSSAAKDMVIHQLPTTNDNIQWVDNYITLSPYIQQRSYARKQCGRKEG